MKIIYFGTPQFAVPTLEKLIANKFAIDLVVTNQDEPKGRGYEVKAPPVKEAALRAGLEVYQPAKLKDPATLAHLSRFRPDVMVVVAYGHILPLWLIGLPRLGCINVHASLLPKYRGAAPIQWSVIRGETIAGVTTMKIDEGLDTGDTLLKREVAIEDEDTAESLSVRLSHVGADLLIETVARLEGGGLAAEPQDHALATLAPILKKEDGRIDWSLPARDIWNRIRGLRPWPGAYTRFRDRGLHIWAAARPVESELLALPPGKLVIVRDGLRIVCGQGTVLDPLEIQMEGRKRLAIRDFLNGTKIRPGEAFG